MNRKALWKPVLLYSGILGVSTVGAVYLTTRSGVYILGVTGVGVLLVALGGGAAGRTGTSHEGQMSVDWAESDSSLSGLGSALTPGISLRLTLLFYGLGIVLWSLVVLATLRGTLA
jgi:hypothetical protein